MSKKIEHGDIIKSERTFGIELEFIVESGNLDDLRLSDFSVVRDGSLRSDTGLPIELVSPILSGIDGEISVNTTCSLVKDHIETSINNSCGFHVHIGIVDVIPTYKNSIIKYEDVMGFSLKSPYIKPFAITGQLMSDLPRQYTHVFQNNLSRDRSNSLLSLYNRIGKLVKESGVYCFSVITKEYLEQAVSATPDDFPRFVETIMGFRETAPHIYLSENELEKITPIEIKDGKLYPKNENAHLGEVVKYDDKFKELLKKLGLNEKSQFHNLVLLKPRNFYHVKKARDHEDRLNKLKNLMSFYVVFDDCIQTLIPASRRTNAYSQSLRSRLSRSDIFACETIDELEMLWYNTLSTFEKENRKRAHYDPSRYYGINFHPTFNKNKTVEIRYHSATVNAHKVLHWTAFHQNIVDNIIDGSIGTRHILEGEKILSPYYKLDLLLDKYLTLTDETKSYIRKRAELFKQTDEFILNRIKK